ncbi:MAG TPA: SAM-dependent methyltransferase [Frankiaceae bacterium]|nr:SAM-dependent methyltransferase [Frankiaceae bacterium]
MKDWAAWHAPYDDPASPLADRLRCVRGHVSTWLATAQPGARVVSACAGQGRDLLPLPGGIRARLVELDPRNAAVAASVAGPDVEVVCGDAGVSDAYAGAVPADLVMVCGVFGNVPDDDVRRTVLALPTLCAPGATVIWTRHTKAPDLTPSVRAWFAESGFEERAFDAPDGEWWSVGVHVLVGEPAAFVPGLRLFAFG